MKIQRIEIQNFRGFDHFTCDLTDPCLIVGNKGSGKTSLMEALAIAAGSLFLGFSDIRDNQRHGIEKKDVHKSGKKSKRLYPVIAISCRGVLNGRKLTWTRTLENKNGRTTSVYAKKIETIAQELQQKIRKGEDIILPIVAYYSANRSWSEKKLNQVETDKPGARTKGYFNWFNPPLNTTNLWNWLRWMEARTRQKGEPFYIFTEFKKALVESLPECPAAGWAENPSRSASSPRGSGCAAGARKGAADALRPESSPPLSRARSPARCADTRKAAPGS